MKARIFSIILLITIFFSGCVVFSFYPLYTEKDLFPNDLLLGTLMDKDSTAWIFEHPLIGDKKDSNNVDDASYTLKIQEKDSDMPDDASFDVRIIKLENNYFLDFYLNDYGNDSDFELYDLHIIPVHTFAKVEFNDSNVSINWFDQDWLEKLIKQNKIRIHHENNGDFILLTAKPKELQKFVTKYVNSEEAFKNGLEVELVRK
jgi:hypothetical protein